MLPEVFKPFSMEDKVVVITGGAGFLGNQYARALTEAGAVVVIWDKDIRGMNCQGFTVDITRSENVKQVTRWTIDAVRKIDVLINNAGMNPAIGSDEAQKMFAPYEKYPTELWEKEVATDLSGAHYCTQAVAPHMMERRSGVIVNIASEVSSIAVDNRIYGSGKFKSIAYITSKTGILGLTRSWASYLGEYGVRVNAFSPGGVARPETPDDFQKKYGDKNMLGRMARIGEYNSAMIFLCSDASSFMTGANLVMDGGKHAW